MGSDAAVLAQLARCAMPFTFFSRGLLSIKDEMKATLVTNASQVVMTLLAKEKRESCSKALLAIGCNLDRKQSGIILLI